MKRLDVLALVIAIAALAVAVFGIYRPLKSSDYAAHTEQAQQGVPEIDLYTDPTDGQCKVMYKTDSVKAHADQIIHWKIVNSCDVSATVDMINFYPSDPLVIPHGPVTVNPGAVGNFLRRVLQNAKSGHYTYDLSVNGARQRDPEIVIE
jgi:hypothetical protein